MWCDRRQECRHTFMTWLWYYVSVVYFARSRICQTHTLSRFVHLRTARHSAECRLTSHARILRVLLSAGLRSTYEM